MLAMRSIPTNKLQSINKSRYHQDIRQLEGDVVAVEEPLQIRLLWQQGDNRYDQIFTVTMRTPGDDRALAVGLLHSEGIITSDAEIINYYHENISAEETIDEDTPQKSTAVVQNQFTVELSSTAKLDKAIFDRRHISVSSCGLCGKTSLQNLEINNPPELPSDHQFLDLKIIASLVDSLRQRQSLFFHCGGVHGAGLFDHTGKLLELAEDIGRHNAVDKLIGQRLIQNAPKTGNEILLSSGRASFEIVQKTIMAGYPVLAAVGAPTSLAIKAAQRFNLTLLGFVNPSSFSVYTGEWRFINRPKQ